ncbi:response regulator [bacterium]|nr:response regulator [bacterium]
MNLPRILIVDDEEEVRQAYLSILKPQRVSDGIDEIAASLFNSTENTVDLDQLTAFFEDDGAEMIVEEGLRTGTYELDEASQGMEAVEKIRHALAEERPYSLLFLDIRMPPGIDGVQAAREIRQLDPNVEIVIMTAYSDYSYEEIVSTVGNPERLLYFHKPFKSSQILQLASTLTQQWYLERKCTEQDRQWR